MPNKYGVPAKINGKSNPEYDRIYRTANSEHNRQIRRVRYEANKAQTLRYQKAWSVANPERRRQTSVKNDCLAIIKAIAILGGKCVGCGNIDPRVLEFDHTNNDGAEHRMVSRKQGRMAFARWIIKDPEQARQKLQLLCANCHAKKHSIFNHIEGLNMFT